MAVTGSNLKFLTLFIAVFALAVGAHAQMGGPPPPPHIKSVELFAATSPTIVLGTVVDYHPRLSNEMLRDVGIAVTETLKGEPTSRLSVTMFKTAAELARWRDRSELDGR